VPSTGSFLFFFTETVPVFGIDMKHRARHRRLHRQRTGAVDLTPPAPVAAPHAPPSADYLAVDAMTRAAEKNGWVGRAGFDVAIRLWSHGVSVADAREMFLHTENWIQ
jgi:hypothetical protein